MSENEKDQRIKALEALLDAQGTVESLVKSFEERESWILGLIKAFIEGKQIDENFLSDTFTSFKETEKILSDTFKLRVKSLGEMILALNIIAKLPS